MAEAEGFEPPTQSLEGFCSNPTELCPGKIKQNDMFHIIALWVQSFEWCAVSFFDRKIKQNRGLARPEPYHCGASLGLEPNSVLLSHSYIKR